MNEPDRQMGWDIFNERLTLPYEVKCGVCGFVFGQGEAVKPRYQNLTHPNLTVTLNSATSNALIAAMNKHANDVSDYPKQHPKHVDPNGKLISPTWYWSWGGKQLDLEE